MILFLALEQLINIGCQRILTSGQKPLAMEGISLLAELVKTADHRIIIMPGSGVRKENIKVLATKTGAIEFHSSLRARAATKMKYVHQSFPEDDYMSPAIDPKEVNALRAELID